MQNPSNSYQLITEGAESQPLRSERVAGAARPVSFKRCRLLFEVVFEVIGIGTMAPPVGNAGESECANGSTNINCNYIGIP